MENSNSKFKNYKTLSLILGILFLLSLEANVLLIKGINSKKNKAEIMSSAVKHVSAENIYSVFECPCCGKAIGECTCPMAQERRNYVDALLEVGDFESEDEITLAYIRKYGLDSFLDEGKQQEIKEKLIAEAPADRPIISITPDLYDFGDVSQKEGRAFTSFDLKNEGESDLVIDRLETSCGCTFVSIVFEGKENPYFTMPGHDNPTDWEGVTIPSGASAQLKVMYDPTVHMDFRGTATRGISVFSNDPIDFEKKVTIEINQVD